MQVYKRAFAQLSDGGEFPILIASSFLARATGLFGLSEQQNGIRPSKLSAVEYQPDLILGLLIKPCSSIHTFFMDYPIGVLYLDKNGVVLKVVHELKPWRVAWCKGAAAALEVQRAVAENATIGNILKIL